MLKLVVPVMLLLAGGVALAVSPWDHPRSAWLARAATAVGLDGERPPAGPVYRTVTVARGDLVSSVSATGALAPVSTVQVGSEVSGQVKEIYADFNSEVDRDQAIALIDPVTFELAVEQAAAELEVAVSMVEMQRAAVERMQAEVENVASTLESSEAQSARARVLAAEADREVARKRALVERGSAPAAELERAQSALAAEEAQAAAVEAQERGQQATVRSVAAQLRSAEAQLVNAEAVVRQRRAALRHAEIQLERTVIRAPVQGVVIQRRVDEGQTVAAALEAPTLFTIAQDLRDMQVNASIDESEIGRILPGQRVEFTVDAYPSRRFAGTVAQIRKSPQTTQNVVTYTVVVEAPNPDLSLLPGMTASARFVVDERREVLTVPNAALRFSPPEAALAAGWRRVWVAGPHGLEAIAVEVGLSDGTHSEVTGEGLEAGLVVVTGVEPPPPVRTAGQRLLGGF
jgi:HlyD family secretion protein